MIFPPEFNQPAVAKHLFPEREGFIDAGIAQLLMIDENHPAQFFHTEESIATIILFPAPNADLYDLEEMADGLLQQQLNLLIIPGRSWSEETSPSFSLQNYTDEGAVLFNKADALLQQKNIDLPLFIAGHGLGILPTITAVLRYPISFKGLFLEGPVCDLQNYLLQTGGSAESESIDNTAYFLELKLAMQSISRPTMIFHGAKDSISTVTQAEKLQAASCARKKQFFVIPGAETPGEAPLCHWAGALYFSTIRTFVDSICGTNSWRQRRQARKQQ